LFLPLLLLNQNRKHQGEIVAYDSIFPSLRECLGILFTFSMVTLAWVFFRAESVTQAFGYVSQIPDGLFIIPNNYRSGLYYVLGLLVLDWYFRKDERTIRFSNYPIIRQVFYLVIVLFILAHFSSEESFIYFQF